MCLASLVTLCRRPEMCQEFLLQSKRYCCCARRPRGPTSFCTSRQNLKAFFFNFNKLESKSELLLVLQNFLSNLTSYCCTGCPGKFEISQTQFYLTFRSLGTLLQIFFGHTVSMCCKAIVVLCSASSRESSMSAFTSMCCYTHLFLDMLYCSFIKNESFIVTHFLHLYIIS